MEKTTVRMQNTKVEWHSREGNLDEIVELKKSGIQRVRMRKWDKK